MDFNIKHNENHEVKQHSLLCPFWCAAYLNDMNDWQSHNSSAKFEKSDVVVASDYLISKAIEVAQ